MSKKTDLETSTSLTPPNISLSQDKNAPFEFGTPKAEFDKVAALASSQNPEAGEYHQGNMNAVLMLGYILKNLAGGHMGACVHDISINYFYSDTDDGHVFEFFPAWEPDASYEEIQKMRSELKGEEKEKDIFLWQSITSFLEELDMESDLESTSIIPERGSILGNSKMDIFQLICRYLETKNIDVVDIASFDLQDPPIPPGEARSRDGIAYRNLSKYAAINMFKQNMAEDPLHFQDLVLFGMQKPYTSLMDFVAQAEAIYCNTDPYDMLLGTSMAICDRMIRIEDGLTTYLNTGLQRDLRNLSPSLN